MNKRESSDKRWLIGITDYVQPPADIEAEAFGDAEFVFLSDWRADPAAAEQWRKLLAYDRASRKFASGWQENLLKPHQRTSDQTLGVIGVGQIGTAVVNRMKSFGYRILGYDPCQPSGHEKAVGYQRTETLEESVAQSDVITIHCPLSDETRGMIDASFLT